MPRHGSCVATAKYLVSHVRETKALELALGLLWLAVLLTMKHLGKSRKCAAMTSGSCWGPGPAVQHAAALRHDPYDFDSPLSEASSSWSPDLHMQHLSGTVCMRRWDSRCVTVPGSLQRHAMSIAAVTIAVAICWVAAELTDC